MPRLQSVTALPSSPGINEFGEEADVVARFTDNPDCENAFKNFMCWLNFPRCDEEDRSLILCRSVCENFFQACKVRKGCALQRSSDVPDVAAMLVPAQYSSDMYRCGAPEYYGGEEPEGDDILDKDGQPIYLRAQFIGQPFRWVGFATVLTVVLRLMSVYLALFRDNQYNDDDEPINVCTPSILNGAPSSFSMLPIVLCIASFLYTYFLRR